MTHDDTPQLWMRWSRPVKVLIGVSVFDIVVGLALVCVARDFVWWSRVGWVMALVGASLGLFVVMAAMWTPQQATFFFHPEDVSPGRQDTEQASDPSTLSFPTRADE